MHLDDTIVGLATPSGESALALIRLSGKDCATFIKILFKKKVLRPRHASLADYRSGDNTLIDQVIYIFYAGKASYTGEPMLEIICHGNPLIAKKIIKDLLSRSCRMAEPGEFTRRAFLNGKMDLSQAEAVIDIIHARNDQALQVAQRQLQGEPGNTVNSLIDSLLEIIAAMEAYIDFPEEDLPEENQEGPIKRLKQLIASFGRLIRTQPCGDFLKQGVKVVLLGSPNAGKSSLLNKLIERERALVDETPGTTRDFIEENTFIGAYPLRLIDTAGLRSTQNSIEQQGIIKTLEQAHSADLLLFVIDTSQALPVLSLEVKKLLSNKRCLVVENKIDLPQSQNHSQYLSEFTHCRVSAFTTTGIDILKEKCKTLLEKDLNLSDSNTIIINARHAHALEESQKILLEATGKLLKKEPPELIVSDLREALNALGEITGKIDNEQVLDKVFQNFCIGK